jgi:hypothetical protein
MSGGGAHLGREAEMAKGGIFSTGCCHYRWRRERRSRRAPWVGNGCQCRARPANKQRTPGSPTSGGCRLGTRLVFESGMSQFGLMGTL